MIIIIICLRCFFVKQKTAYELRISDWSSDVCSSDLGPLDDYRRPDVRSLRRLAALIEEDRGYFGHRHRLKSYIHAGRNVMCCPRKSSRMRRRIDAVARCHELAEGRREQADVGAERDEGRAGRDLVARILGVAGEHAGRLAGAADALDAFYSLGFGP